MATCCNSPAYHSLDVVPNLINICIWAVLLRSRLTVVMSQKLSIIQEVNMWCHMWLGLGRKSEPALRRSDKCVLVSGVHRLTDGGNDWCQDADRQTDRQQSVRDRFKRQSTHWQMGQWVKSGESERESGDEIHGGTDRERNKCRWRNRSKVEQKGTTLK